MPVRVQRVRAGEHEGQRTGPGQSAAEQQRAQQPDAGHPGHVAQHVQAAAGQVHAGTRGIKYRHRGQGERCRRA
jgi:hypothetical protein